MSVRVTFSDDGLHAFCTAQFGPEGEASKKFAASEGDALFAAFMTELDKVPADNAHKELIVTRAKQRRYHDYEGDLMKLGLVMDLQEAGLSELATRVKSGEFDF